jgi:hypothetical protein
MKTSFVNNVRLMIMKVNVTVVKVSLILVINSLYIVTTILGDILNEDFTY